MPELKELSSKIESTWEKIKAKNDEVLAEAKGAVTRVEQYRAEDRQELEKMNSHMDELKGKLDEAVLKIGRSAVVKPGEKSAEDTERDTAYKSAFFKYLRQGKSGMSAEDWKAMKEALPAERKALVQDTAGLYLVPEDMEAEIMRAVPQINTLRQYCRVRTTNRNSVKVNSISETAIGWGKIELGKTITESTLVPTQDTIYAEDLYGLTKVGEDEMMDTDANLAALIGDSFSVAIGNAEAKAFTVGLGHATYEEPDGVAVDATIIASHKINLATADVIVPDDMLKIEYALGTQYLNGAAWLMNRKTELVLRLYKEAVASGYYGNYLWAPGLNGGPDTFDAFPIVRQNDMNYPADAVAGVNVVFGNFNLGYMIIERKGIAVQRLDELYAEEGMVGFKVHRRVGGGVYRPAAFYAGYNNT
jgi:HK97 family phage major capsid protein